MNRATVEEFEAWKAGIIADPTKLDSLPKSVADYWRKEFMIEKSESHTPSGPRPVVLNSQNPNAGINATLILRENATFEEIAEFTYRLTAASGFLTEIQFTELLNLAGDSLARIGSSWDQVIIYLKGQIA